MTASPANIGPTGDSPEAQRYNRIHRRLGVSDFLLGFVLLVVLLATGWTGALRDLAYQSAAQHYTLAVGLYVLMLMLLVKIAGLGFSFYGFRLEHSFHLSNQRFRGWAWDETKGFLIGLLLGILAAELLYFLVRTSPQHWWLWCWAMFLGFFILMAQLAPVVLFPIFYKFEPLQDEELKMRLVRLGTQAGSRVRGVYKWHLSQKSKKANAALTGLGNTRRIILADTLLENYSPEEIEAVLAHELGHHVHKHILKMMAVQAVITFVGFWAANWSLHYATDRLGMFTMLSDFANLPLLLLVATVLSFLLMPAMNAYSRYCERQADRYAFDTIGNVGPFISSMNKLAEQNLAEKTPSRLVEWFFHSHPAISRRVAAAQAWAKTNA
jgi:Zn-dependent protease with chaperone function